MSASLPRSSSAWKRSRYWATLACMVALVAGLLTLAAGHPLHGSLMLLGALMLVNSTIWGRRGRRQAPMPAQEEVARSAPAVASRKWHEAA